MFADLHLHTSASDGTLTPKELVSYAKEKNISIVAITDHDTVDGFEEARRSIPDGVELISGVEFSCIYDGGEPFLLHILGYGIDTDSDGIKKAVKIGRDMRRGKHSARLEYLSRVFGIKFTEAERFRLERQPSVGKLHIAAILIERGYATGIGEAVAKFMSSPDFPDGRISYKTAISGIIEAGGIPVYAHPLGGEGEEHLSISEVAHRVRIMRSAGVMGLECYYSRYTDKEIEMLLSLAEDMGMYVSGGSDFHGENKTVPIGCLSADGTSIFPKRLSMLTKLSVKKKL